MKKYTLITILVVAALMGAFLLCDSFRGTTPLPTAHTTHHTHHVQSAIALPQRNTGAIPLSLLFFALLTCITSAVAQKYTLTNKTLSRSVFSERGILGKLGNHLAQSLRTGILHPKIFNAAT